MRGMTHRIAGRAICLIGLAAVLLTDSGWASSRVALVVGNGGYAAENIPALANPVNDAKVMAKALETSGFEVRLVTDADQAGMRTAIEAFGEQLEQAGGDAVGLFYYAGHGVEVRGHNYLIPTGAEIERAVEFQTDAVPAEWVLSWMEAAGNRLNVVILDACRNNPFGKHRGGSQGLAQMDAPSGTLIAYSAAPGQVAVDGEGENSPYTAALALALAEPGLKVEDVFKRVRVTVETATNAKQTPWESSSLRGDFYFVAKAKKRPAPAPSPITVPETVTAELTVQQLAARAYEAAERIPTISSYQLVIEQFPGTLYAGLAEQQIEKLKAATTPPALSAEEAEASLGLERAERKRIQIGLRALGVNPGSADGLFGPRTRRAISKWQSSRGEPATGYLDASSAAMLLEAGEAAPPPKPNRIVVQEAMDILSEALSTARSIADADGRNNALRAIARVQVKSGAIAEALSTARGIGEDWQRASALSDIAEAQANSGAIAEALSTARSIADADDRASALSAIARVQANSGDRHGASRTIAEALSIARSIGEDIYRASALSAIARVQANSGAIAEALSTARGIGEDWQRASALSDIAEVQAKSGDRHGASRTIAEALSIARSIGEDIYRASALSDIAEAQANSGAIAEALSTARSIGEDTYRASALSDIAEVQANSGDRHGASRTIAEALSTARSIGDDTYRAWALRAIAGAQANSGAITEALSTARSIGDDTYRARALLAIAGAQANSGAITEALSTARSIGDDTYRAWALRAIAGAQANSGAITEALSTARSIAEAEPVNDIETPAVGIY